MVQKCDELSWFERMTKELENYPEYLREYIILCSDEIKCQEDKIAALEQLFNALSTKFSALVEEKAALKRERDELKEENETLRCHAHDAELAFERNAELKAENATIKKALDGLKQQLTAIGKVANFVLYKGEEAQKLAMEIENIIDPLYCPKCGACGEEGCCSPDRCIELPCLYGEHYLKSYKELEAENATLRKRLEPIEEWWDRNCSEYIRKKHQKWDASMYEAIEKAMELKEGE